MNTKSKSDKAEVDNLYKTAIENQGKLKADNSTLYTFTPNVSIKRVPKQVALLLHATEGKKKPF